MPRVTDLVVRVITDTKQAVAGMDKAAGGVDKFRGRVEAAALPAAAIGAGLAVFGKAAVDAASKAQQAMGAVDSVFGKSAGQIKQWASQSAESVGLASSQYAELASVLGSQLRNMGVPMGQIAGKTDELIRMGADLAATYGGTTAQAVEALGSALRGETDPIERYGISIKQADIAARQAKDGTKGLTGEAGKQAKTAALLALATEQAGGALGQFARESDSAAGSAQIASARWEDAQAALGQALLPAVSAVAGVLGTLAGVMQDNATATQIVLGVLGALVVGVLAVNAAMKVYQATLVVVQAVQKATWLSNPIFLVIAAVLLLVAGIVLLWKRSETFRNIVLGAWAAIKAAGATLLSWLQTAWNAVFRVIGAYVRAYALVFRVAFAVIRAVASAVGNAVKAVWNVVFAVIRAYVMAWRAAFLAAFNAARNVALAIAGAVRRAWEAVFSALKRAVSAVGSALSGPFNTVKRAIDAVIGAVRDLIGWFGRIKIPKISLPKIPGFNSSSSAAMAAPSLASSGMATTDAMVAAGAFGAMPLSSPRTGSTGGAVVINISGAIDPESTARQVRRLLAAHDRRTGTGGAGLRTV